MADALRYIGIARMAGGIETGEENTKALIKSGKARLVLLASDTSPTAKRRAEGYVYGTNVPILKVPYRKEELSAISGRPGCSMAAFTDTGLAACFSEALYSERGEAYREISETMAAKRDRAKQRAKKQGKRRKNA